MRRRHAVLGVGILTAGTILTARTVLARPQATFRAGTEAVRVDVLVSDRGNPVPGLTADDFELLDNGVRQAVRLVETGEVPVSVTLVLDTSQSVAGERLQRLVGASTHLLETLQPRDRATLVVFDDRVRTLVSASSDFASIRRELERVTPGGRTSLNDAAYTGLMPSGTGDGRRLTVLFSDGADTSSWLDRDAVLRAARRTETVVYGIGLRDRLETGDGSDVMRSILEALPGATGGELLQADTTRDLDAVFARVMSRFRQRYWLAYSPQGVKAGDGWHTLTVKARARRLKVKSRAGYYSPAPAGRSTGR
jgi:Ca-activated chloride channel family protein